MLSNKSALQRPISVGKKITNKKLKKMLESKLTPKRPSAQKKDTSKLAIRDWRSNL